MLNKIFIDSNIWLYLFLRDDCGKYKTAEKYVRENANNTMFISYQVINEVTNQLLRKGIKEAIVREEVEYMFKICTIHNFSKDVVLLASSIRTDYSISFWDSVIAASAINAGCDILASEDMQDGLKIENMVIRNIFK
jgi:predicted nucleic acid-binding protein